MFIRKRWSRTSSITVENGKANLVLVKKLTAPFFNFRMKRKRRKIIKTEEIFPKLKFHRYSVPMSLRRIEFFKLGKEGNFIHNRTNIRLRAVEKLKYETAISVPEDFLPSKYCIR